ncbi:MAG TPA: hypothetical protein VFZ61_20680, partial [Polyangiales bacterium]
MSKATPAKRRFPRWLKRSLIVLACLPIALPVLALSALAIPLTRKPILKLALDLTNPALGGYRIELDEARRLDLWGIELRGARFFDDKQREMVSVKRVKVAIAPFALLRGTLRLPEVYVDGARVHLYLDGPDEPEEPETDSGPMTFQFLGDAVHVRDATLDMPLIDKQLHVQLRELQGAGGYGPITRGQVQKLHVVADLDGRRATELRSRYADWDEKRGGRAVITGELAGAELRIAAEVPAITDSTAWPVTRAVVDLKGLTPRGLERVGYAELVQLRRTVDLHVQAETRGKAHEELAAGVTLRAGPTRLQIDARATPTHYVAQVSVPPVQLDQVAGILPALHVGARLSLTLRHEPKPMLLQVRGQRLVFDHRDVPDLELSARLPLPTMVLERLRFAGLEQALSLRGKYDLDTGNAQVALETTEFQLASLGGLVPEGTQGTLNGSLNAELTGQQLGGHSDLSLRYFRMNDLAIDNASLGLDLSGRLRDPRGHIALGARQLRSGSTKLLRVELDAKAGPSELVGDLSVEGVDRFVSLALNGTRAKDGSVTLDANGEGRIKDKRLGLSLVQLKLGSEGSSVAELNAFSGKERIQVSGSLDKQNQLDASVKIVQLDLEPIGRLALAYPLTGRLSLSARAHGPVERPDFSLDLALHAVHSERTPRAPRIDLKAQAALDMEKREATIRLDTHSQDRRVELKLTGKADLYKRTQQLGQAFERSHLALDLVGKTDLPFLSQFAEPHLNDLDGDITLDLSINGTM